MSRKHWAALATVAALGAWAGYSFRAPVVEYRERVVERTDQTEKIKALTEQLDTLKRHTRRTETRQKLPDGTEHTTVVTDTHVDRVRDTRTDLDSHTETKTETVATREVRPLPPKWHVGGLLVGTLHLGNPSLSVGAIVNRHLFGPLSVGLSATVPVQQPLSIPAVALSLTVGF